MHNTVITKSADQIEKKKSMAIPGSKDSQDHWPTICEKKLMCNMFCRKEKESLTEKT